MDRVIKFIVALCLIPLLAVATAGCIRELSLMVWEPAEGAILTSPQAYVKGKVSDPKAIVTVNGSYGWKNKKTGEFLGTAYFVEGENIIEVVATKGKKVASRTFTIIYQPEQ